MRISLRLKVLRRMSEVYPITMIGPTVPSKYLDKGVEDDTYYSVSLFKQSDSSYVKWLNEKEKGLVLSVSFGSMAELGEEQVEEVIRGIKQSNKCFLWVVRETEQSKLPRSFTEEVLEIGLIVPWCSQLEVLAHETVGCFISHCEWNSTMEALCLGVPIVGMPHIWDQPTNAMAVETMFRVGVRVQMDEKGFVRREEIEIRIREVMKSEKGKVMNRNASKWRELAKEAIDAGGSSDRNIEEFVASIVSARN